MNCISKVRGTNKQPEIITFNLIVAHNIIDPSIKSCACRFFNCDYYCHFFGPDDIDPR